MNTKKLLVTTALFAPALLAFALPASKVRFAAADGTKLTKTIESKSDFSLDSMSMKMNGQEPPGGVPEMEMTISSTQKVSLTDEYVKSRDGAPTKLRRTFDDIASDMSMSMKMEMMGKNGDNNHATKAQSELKGKTVVFTWDADAKEYKVALDPKEDGSDLVKGLKEDIDFRALLPKGYVKEGEEWDVDVKELAGVLAPGGDLHLKPEEKESKGGPMGGDMAGMGGLSDWLGDVLEGDAKAKLTGLSDKGGKKLATIKLNIKVHGSKDMTEIVKGAMSKAEMPQGAKMDFDHMDIEFKIEGEGQLVWDLESGHAVSFELSGPASATMDMGMKLDMGGQSMNIEQGMQMSGTSSISVKFE